MTNTSITIGDIRTLINRTSARSAWSRGVKVYANELLDGLCETVAYAPEALDNETLLFKALLNGARDWTQYSEGGCSLIYSDEIASRLCTKTELIRTQNGCKAPNPREQWLDVQARALFQAGMLIRKAYREAANHE